MQEIGSALKEARSRLGLTLEEAERSTRIRTRYLEALEAGEFDTLPSQVQTRGFLKNYAEFLGLDPEPLLEQYSDSLHTARTIPLRRNAFSEATTRPSVVVRSRRPTWLSADLFIAGFITLAVVAVLIWGFGRVAASLRERTQESSAFLIETSTPLPPTAAPTETPAAVVVTDSGGATPTATLELIAVPGNAVDIRLLIERRAFLVAVVDGVEVFRGRPASGELLEFLGADVVEITTGNGGGVRVFFQGEDQGLMGGVGEVVNRLWTLDGAVTPTPSPTPGGG